MSNLPACIHSNIEEDNSGPRLIKKCKRCGCRWYSDCPHNNTIKTKKDNLMYERCEKCKTYIKIRSTECEHNLVSNGIQTNDGHQTYKCRKCSRFIRIPCNRTQIYKTY